MIFLCVRAGLYDDVWKKDRAGFLHEFTYNYLD